MKVRKYIHHARLFNFIENDENYGENVLGIESVFYFSTQLTRGSVVGSGTMLQAGRSRVRVPMRWIIFNLPNPSSRNMALVSTQPLTEMSTMNLPGGKGRPARKADNLTAIVSQLSRKCGRLDVPQPYRPSLPVTGIALPLPSVRNVFNSRKYFAKYP
jgi:hypothetical protein